MKPLTIVLFASALAVAALFATAGSLKAPVQAEAEAASHGMPDDSGEDAEDGYLVIRLEHEGLPSTARVEAAGERTGEAYEWPVVSLNGVFEWHLGVPVDAWTVRLQHPLYAGSATVDLSECPDFTGKVTMRTEGRATVHGISVEPTECVERP